ncbi:MFS transporter [Luteipulveratus halotolerans]|uniref:MFS transporter n=1 Tax=Luteipulveratus halotolerans TaxID=1631356 RepID=UPI000B14FDBA
MTDTLTATTPSPTRTYGSLRAAWIPLAALCLAFFVEMVDNTLLSIALPTIGRDLGSGTTSLQWVTGAYSLTFGGLLLTAGSVADRFGRRRVLLVGLAMLRNGTVRGALIAQVATSIAMAAVMFGLILHFQYAYGWSPVRAGLANCR